MPMMLVRAEDLGVRGDASPAELNADAAFMRRLEALRIEAGARMGIADAGNKVIPKPVLLSAPQQGGDLQVRYFMPHQCHTALAITGAVGLATAAVTPGTLAHTLVGCLSVPGSITLEHPSGALEVGLSRSSDDAPVIASVVRTARRLFEGRVYATSPAPATASATQARQWTSAA
jgi:2-methylaconitate cis-trans-isomerase PrpF